MKLGVSEPTSGTDTTSLRTRAEKKGDHYVVNGQKIWTSGAHFADVGILVTRSDPNVPKHKGLSAFGRRAVFLLAHTDQYSYTPARIQDNSLNIRGLDSHVHP